ncbi:carbohydrate ABC transporter permease [Anaerosacchariphilus polymeriproducens]|uniref:Sugar ABC transporter permease n=1 Tax=Anaerosacchariphilus polymeriproducens TaxID=1812858 RepID=A0A371AWZ7_9FIRM|nr:sugar ABC transporter permease [Anaerosacchariphilus polymeriproducens]RDU24069.1 sugar ABC transporter permease [Anaerosacchariphilus polymeriproducens]
MTLRQKLSTRKYQQKIIIITFLLVPMLLLIIFTYLPFVDMVKFSFFKWNGTSPTMKFIGLKNYKDIFTKPEYLEMFKTSLYYLIGSFIQIAIALYFATVLNYKLRAKNFFKGVIFFPYLINGVAIGFAFMYFFREFGTLDTLLTSLGIAKSNLPLWLGNPKVVNYSLASVSVWRYLGQNMVMFSGAIASVSPDLYEAASIDGANRWQQFKYIIFPNIKIIISLNLILAVKGAISVFEIPKIMTDGANGSSTFVLKTLDTAFTVHKVGLASAMGVILLLIIMIITFVQKRFFEGKEA